MVNRSLKQNFELRGYSVVRRYTLRNRHLTPDATMTALLVYQAGKGKHFSVLHAERVNGIVQHALMDLLKGEEERSKHDSSQTEINKSNYYFALLGKEKRDGRMCYRLRLIPRKSSNFLITGDMWVDLQEFAIVCLKGRPAKSVSFWVGKPYVEQHFLPVNGFWMPSSHRSTAQVKLVGTTELTIDYKDYKVNPALSERAKRLSTQ